MKVINNSKYSFIGNELLKKVYSTAYRLDANVIVINKVRYNKYAEIELFENNDCIDLHYKVSTN